MSNIKIKLTMEGTGMQDELSSVFAWAAQFVFCRVTLAGEQGKATTSPGEGSGGATFITLDWPK